jgi:NDP-sugar pyrophosphorylase family protein
MPNPVPVTAPARTDPRRLLQIMRERSVRQLPVVDGDNRVVDIVLLNDLLPEPTLPVRALIMAGGLGSRLKPLTEETPKPMLPVGGRPMLEFVIDQLRESGIVRITIATCYKPEKIRDHFHDGADFGVEIVYVNEDAPMGTGGAIGLLSDVKEPLFIINGDVLTQVNYQAMLAFHQEQNADLSVAVGNYNLQIPYGVLECEGSRVKRITEKPSLAFFVNAGIYLLEPSALPLVPQGRRFDMTEFIQILVDAGRPVASFPMIEYWLDIGQHGDYQKAQDDMRNGRVRGD